MKLLEEMRARQAHLTTLADGEMPPSVTAEPPDLAAFVAGLSSAWRAGEIRPTFSRQRRLATCVARKASLEAQPDQTAVELLIEFRAPYPEHYSLRQLCTLERRVRVRRREAVQRLMCQMKNLTQR